MDQDQSTPHSGGPGDSSKKRSFLPRDEGDYSSKKKRVSITDNSGHKRKFKERYALTFGEVAILHVGGEELGHGRREVGFSVSELQAIAAKYDNAELHSLNNVACKGESAALLIIRGGAKTILSSEEDAAHHLFEEQERVSYDRTFFDSRRRRMLNKRARFNIVFGEQGQKQRFHRDGKDLSPAEFTSKSFEVASTDVLHSIESFKNLPLLGQLRDKLPSVFGEKSHLLNAEGNHYYEKKSFIGWHGDAERKIVMCLSLGRTAYLRFAWRKPGSSENIGMQEFKIRHGDFYVMSEKATGFDWRMRSKWRLVHSAGSERQLD